MTHPVSVDFAETDIDRMAGASGRVAVIVTPDGKLDVAARRANRLTKGAVKRLVESPAWDKLKPGDAKTLQWPTGMACEALDVVCLPRNASVEDARRGGAGVGKLLGEEGALVYVGSLGRAHEFVFGLVARAYTFRAHKTDEAAAPGGVTVMASKPDALRTETAPALAVAEGVFYTRDLVNEPANHLTTTEFANRIKGLQDIGLKVTVLEEEELKALGMHLLLSVGHGSASPSKVAVMEWMGGETGEAPLALVGKGVVFDTGGISLKPAAGMEEMTMDMGGAGVVAGTMRVLAARKARANVVGLVGLVENMPSDRATRPGDVVTSMKGDTVEIINTDAEGRLVLADVLWYAQKTYKPAGIIDLATLTGAIIIGLGHEKAGVFSNDDAFCNAFLKAADAEGEGAWRMPLGDAYDKQLKSAIADMKNVGGRPAGSITAAQFLQCFVEEGCPWIHLDIAGVARVGEETMLAPKGSTGWGVMALNRLVADGYETG